MHLLDGSFPPASLFAMQRMASDARDDRVLAYTPILRPLLPTRQRFQHLPAPLTKPNQAGCPIHSLLHLATLCAHFDTMLQGPCRCAHR